MVEILLATYNGEKYVREQIDSILNQSCQDFKLLVRDDGSSDGTIDIIKEYQNRYLDKISVIEDDFHCGNATANFMELTKCAKADYVMYCDQDDIWLPNKIEITLRYMKAAEAEIGLNKPILVYPKYKVVNEKLQMIKNKNAASQVEKANVDLNHLLVQNCVTGCLMMCNKALYTLVGDYDESILMHDWWAALIASAMGKIVPVAEEVMLYRQHGDNVVGSVDVKSWSYRWGKLTNPQTRDAKFKYRNQAQLFMDRYYEELSMENRVVVKNFLDIYETKFKLNRVRKLLLGHYLKSDVIRAIGQLWYI